MIRTLGAKLALPSLHGNRRNGYACTSLLSRCSGLPGTTSWHPEDTSGDLQEAKKTSEVSGGAWVAEHYQERIVKINNLVFEDTCTIQVSGKYGETSLTYKTPECSRTYACTPLPDIPQNVTILQYEDWNDTWRVHVRWASPAQAPSLYEVTLRTNKSTQAITIPGNMTEMEFSRVRGDGEYNVSLTARSAKGREVHTSRRTIFPTRQAASMSTALLVGVVWLCALLVSVALLIAVVYWRRRMRAASSFYYRDPFEKIHQEGDIDMCGTEAGTEDQWEVRPERLLLHEVIGEGAFGVVRRGTFAPSNKEVAVKMLKGFPSADENRSFRAEMELMKSVGAHPHVVSLLGCCSGRRPLIVAEYCGRGDLLTYLRCSWDMMMSRRNINYYNNKEGINYRNYIFKNKRNDSKFVSNRLYDLQGAFDTELTYRDLLSFCRQIAMGMEFLASNRVVHRDLAARNVLVTADRTLKIADFGLSRDVYQENQYKQEGNGKMPVKWMAPESLTHRIYTTQSDVWSFGVVMWEVVTLGGAPYAGVGAERLPRLLLAGYRMPRPPDCTPALYELMLSCWKEGPRSRPTFGELHAALDELLCACADHYLSLALPADPPAAPRERRYMRMLLRSMRKRGKSYERPLAASTNHYTDQPAAAPRC
ncbi:tyrosine-protein kinase receptor torso-like [Melitaea cinxia]|uniref:tyrosine-protein kinase receptor torso-like n=1 Tax=Melitaea cinxia TaxID=113334 RepID=UPI001E26EDD7|nr:tyrosine-protein kinase receptor torso-like [Melitaea cinxia]